MRTTMLKMIQDNQSANSFAARLTKHLAWVKILGSNSSMMQNLMMDLLDLAQIENNTFKLNKAFFNLPEAIRDAMQVVGHNAEMKNLRIVGPVMSAEDEEFFE